jgi:hypothetical protein
MGDWACFTARGVCQFFIGVYLVRVAPMGTTRHTSAHPGVPRGAVGHASCQVGSTWHSCRRPKPNVRPGIHSPERQPCQVATSRRGRHAGKGLDNASTRGRLPDGNPRRMASSGRLRPLPLFLPLVRLSRFACWLRAQRQAIRDTRLSGTYGESVQSRQQPAKSFPQCADYSYMNLAPCPMCAASNRGYATHSGAM